MKRLFDELSHHVSRITTKKYSTSFSLGIMALSPAIRPAIYSIYGFVRLADEIVDSFHDFDKKELLERFRQDTIVAIDEGISLNPILNSFQETVNQFDIGRPLIEQFLKSMEMDLNPQDYDESLYKEYILGSAEVVGLMCLHVFVEGDSSTYAKLKPYAMKLGSAFQKVNFLRDLKDDHYILGRTYFPNVDMLQFNNKVKTEIEEDIKSEFDDALIGIRMLPASSRFGVYLAYRYYRSLFRKIQDTPASKILNSRIRIANSTKLSLMMSSYVQYKFAAV